VQIYPSVSMTYMWKALTPLNDRDWCFFFSFAVLYFIPQKPTKNQKWALKRYPWTSSSSDKSSLPKPSRPSPRPPQPPANWWWVNNVIIYPDRVPLVSFFLCKNNTHASYAILLKLHVSLKIVLLCMTLMWG